MPAAPHAWLRYCATCWIAVGVVEVSVNETGPFSFSYSSTSCLAFSRS
jgi:hypothetical protein